MEDLKEAIKNLQNAVAAGLANNRDLANYFIYLEVSLRHRYARTGVKEDLKEVVKYL